jgi:hypothetical protein
MTMGLKRIAAAGTVSLILSGQAAAWTAPAQQPSTPAPAASPAPAPASASVPVSEAEFRRIKEALGTQPNFTVNDDQLKFYVQVLAKQPSFADWVKGYDLMNGPVKRGNPMTHQEFLTLVTPKELYSSGGITAKEMVTVAVTNWLGQTLLKKAFEQLRNAKDEREAQEIRDRINRELAALRGE